MRHIPGLYSLIAICLLAGDRNDAFGQALCPDWKDGHTKIVEAKPGDDLASITQQAASGTTILLAPGTYKVQAGIQFLKDDITMRSKSGNRNDVILDGNGGGTPLQPSKFLAEIVAISASRITIADLTIRYAKYHAIHAYPPSGKNISDPRMRNLHIHDCGEQQIKVNSNGETPAFWVDRGIVECSLVEFLDNSVMEPFGDTYYTGGMDVHGGLDWIVRGNIFRNFQRNGVLMEHGVHFWNKSRGTLIENNRFENNYRAIGLGMRTDPYTVERKYPDGKGNSPYLDHIGGIVRNNVIWNRKGIHLEAGIEIMNADGAEIYNNTIVSGDAPFSGIEYRWPNTSITVKNNLLSHNLNPRDGAKAVLVANVENTAATSFKDAASGDLHLSDKAAAAIDKGAKLSTNMVDTDFDGKARGATPDIGAYEFNPGTPLRTGQSAPPAPVLWKMFGTRFSSILFRNADAGVGEGFRLIDGKRPPIR